MLPEMLNRVVPLAFDHEKNPAIWNVPPSQAFLSNKEQIYMAYPELQKAPMTQLPATLIEFKNSKHTNPNISAQILNNSACELKKALEPPIHKYMVCP